MEANQIHLSRQLAVSCERSGLPLQGYETVGESAVYFYCTGNTN